MQNDSRTAQFLIIAGSVMIGMGMEKLFPGTEVPWWVTIGIGFVFVAAGGFFKRWLRDRA